MYLLILPQVWELAFLTQAGVQQYRPQGAQRNCGT